MSTPTANQNASGHYRRYWVYVLMLTLVMVNYIDRSALSIVAKSIATEFGLSPVQMGYVFSSFLWSYTICLLPIGVLVDRYSYRAVSSWGIAIWSLALVATAGAWNFSAFTACRIVMGAGEATSVPANARFVREWAPARERGTASAIWGSGSFIGSAVGAILVAGAASAWGWRGAFVALGVLGIVWLLCNLIWFDRPEKVKWLSAEERNLILTERGVQTNEDLAAKGSASSFLVLLRSPAMWGAMIVHGATIYTVYLLLFWLPTYLQTIKHLSIMTTGLYTAAPWAIAVPVSLALGILSDKLLDREAVHNGKRRWAVVGCVTLGAAAILLVPLANDTGAILALFAIALAGINAAFSLNTALVTDLVQQPKDLGKAITLMVLSANIFGMLAPIVTGYVVEGLGQYDWAFGIAGILLVIAAVAVATLTGRPILQAASVRLAERTAQA
jgi:MFS family permease